VCIILPDATGEGDAAEQLRVDVSLAFEATADGQFELNAQKCGFSCRSFTDSQVTFQTIFKMSYGRMRSRCSTRWHMCIHVFALEAAPHTCP
jgi:hypothetical protein